MISRKRKLMSLLGKPMRKRTKTTKRRKPRATMLRTGGFIGLENKFVDYQRGVGNFSLAWGLLNPTAAITQGITAQGDGPSNRDGKRYTIHKLYIRGVIGFPQVLADTSPQQQQICRLMLVLDRQSNGANLTPANVVANTTVPVNATQNLENTSRYRVLRDKTYYVRPQIVIQNGTTPTFANQQAVQTFKMTVKFPKGLVVNMNNTTADIANVVDNSIHLMGVATSTGVNIAYTTRARFTG